MWIINVYYTTQTGESGTRPTPQIYVESSVTRDHHEHLRCWSTPDPDGHQDALFLSGRGSQVLLAFPTQPPLVFQHKDDVHGSIR